MIICEKCKDIIPLHPAAILNPKTSWNKTVISDGNSEFTITNSLRCKGCGRIMSRCPDCGDSWGNCDCPAPFTYLRDANGNQR